MKKVYFNECKHFEYSDDWPFYRLECIYCTANIAVNALQMSRHLQWGISWPLWHCLDSCQSNWPRGKVNSAVSSSLAVDWMNTNSVICCVNVSHRSPLYLHSLVPVSALLSIDPTTLPTFCSTVVHRWHFMHLLLWRLSLTRVRVRVRVSALTLFVWLMSWRHSVWHSGPKIAIKCCCIQWLRRREGLGDVSPPVEFRGRNFQYSFNENFYILLI